MSHAYVAEPIDIDDLETLFTANWDQRTNGEIPLPVFATSDIVRFDPSTIVNGAAVNISYGEVMEFQDGMTYQHVRRRVPITIDIWTRRESTNTGGGINRQFLHDMKAELRRIIYANKHSLTNWQVMRYGGFHEIFEDSVAGRFHGQITLELEAEGQVTATELVDEDDFDRSSGAIGANWGNLTGTWEVVSATLAALQSATANAHMTFANTALKANVRLEVQVTTAASMDAGVLFRWQNASNYWVVRLEESGGVHYVRLYTNTATTFVQVAERRLSSTTFDWADGDVVELSVDLKNNLIAVAINGGTVIFREDTYLVAETDHGLYSDSDQNTRFNNFRVFESGGQNR